MRFYICALFFCLLNAAARAEILLPDPTIFFENGTYYLTGTGAHMKSGRAFPLYKSKDLVSWQQAGHLLDIRSGFGECDFWAPQIFKNKDGTYELLFCAKGKPDFSEKVGRFVACAKSDKIDFKNARALKTDVFYEIDPFLFVDDDSQLYLYYTRGPIYGVKINSKFERISEVKKLLGVTLDWERKPLPDEFKALNEKIDPGKLWDRFHHSRGVSEGPTLIKRGGKYVLFYSANDFRSPDYCVGVAVADSPLGDFKKIQDGPVISREIVGFNGSGHGDIFFDKNGAMWYVFHTHNSNIRIHPRRTAIVKLIETFGEDGYPRYKADASSLRLL